MTTSEALARPEWAIGLPEETFKTPGETYTETYRDRVLTVTAIANSGQARLYTSSYDGAQHWSGVPPYTTHEVTVNGRYAQSPRVDSVEQVVTRMRKYIDRWIADDEVRTRVQAVIANADRTTIERLRSAESFDELPVGCVAWVAAMGQRRRGIVTKHGKVNVEIAYSTASSPTRVVRKSVPITHAWIES